MPIETSSPAAGNNPAMETAATAFAAVIADPISPKPVAAAATVSGTTNDIEHPSK
ncbi:hypothetical protein Mkiyose1595_57070 [Mycobacterium kiyosense]|nr:hypothetical protein Mkiyose1595_57070 [Mycobacterium kiyosense]